jgi:protein-S-isoprenylcysteine O-methyltransferase Ste14
MLTVFRGNEGLLKERFRAPVQKEQPFWDKILISLLLITFGGLVAFIPLDVFRYHLLNKPGLIVSAMGLLLFAVGWTISTLALRENAFAAPVVKLQQGRYQRVIDSGPYRIVRHPMYAGAVPLMVGLPLWLQSYAGALLALLPIGVVALRAVAEERFLQRELAGYEAYTKRVRYRLIPFVW